MDIQSRRASGVISLERQKITNLYDAERAEFRSSQEAAKEWRALLTPHNARQKQNIIGMQRAVAISSKAGPIDYYAGGCIDADLNQAGNSKRGNGQYAEKLKIILRASEKQDELRKQIEASALQEKRIQKKQAAKAVASAKKSTSLADWLNEYGRPKRKPAKEEQFFTFNAGPVGIIPYVKSTVTWGQEAKTQAKLAELGNATARPSRAVDPGDKADQPCVFFETARSNGNSYRRGNLSD
jgi:hypothetical protein